ncbi:MAG: hypothetical protein Unbinned3972contig1001_59 [Prokaryotic dsDNA virus sp.]|nr:MAG: hypothetical protein Unbinned3972contig1001_59 [Prokaryotic dsDNA virus sp.]|tara:strand:+ start:44361 stop:44624 length:264 start_codon:yes stop_codon:yes gene_type:complete
MEDILPWVDKTKEELKQATDAQRNATLAFDRLLSAVHTIDFWAQKNSDAHKLLIRDIEDDFQTDEWQRKLYFKIIDLIHDELGDSVT